MYSCYLHNWSSHEKQCPACTRNNNNAFMAAQLIHKLDGVAAVNLAEPSGGDLERVTKAYREALTQLAESQKRIAELEQIKVPGRLEFQLAESQKQVQELLITLQYIEDDLANPFGEHAGYIIGRGTVDFLRQCLSKHKLKGTK